jgi:cell pole-organizing protein PopZ
MALLTNMESTSATDDSTVEADQVSRLKRYDRRVEEWLGSLKDEAEQRSPEVLGALAAKAKDVAEYLDKMAERARSKQEVADDPGPSVPAQATSDDDESSTSASRDPGSSMT